MFTNAPRAVASAAAVAVLALMLGACSSPNSAPPKNAPTNSATPDPGDAASQLSRFYDQKLQFGPCDDYATTTIDTASFAKSPNAQCARLEVPMDYDKPDGDTAKLAVLRVPARGKAIGSMVVNPGGPGGPGLQLAAETSAKWAKTPMTQRFDIVGFDPRGAGASTPAVSCFTDAEADAGKVAFTLRGSVGTWTERDTHDLVDRCVKGSGEEILAHDGTRDSARDMDVLRAVLGDDKLTFVGQSYGTRLGTVYAAMFPKKVRAMVLDGAVDPTENSAQRKLSQYAGFQRSFDQMAAACATDPSCPLGTDPSRATQVFQSIVRPLATKPLPAGNGRQVGFSQATGAITAGLYGKENWPVLIKAIAELKTGRGDTALLISDLFSGRGKDGRWSNFGESNYAVGCMDEQRTTPQQEVALRAQLSQAAPYLDPGTGAEGARDGCEFWPAKPNLGFPYADHIDRGLAPTLTISITGDPSTPFVAGTHLAEALGGSVLKVNGEQHTVAMSGANACVNAAVADYLVNLKTPAADASCTID